MSEARPDPAVSGSAVPDPILIEVPETISTKRLLLAAALMCLAAFPASAGRGFNKNGITYFATNFLGGFSIKYRFIRKYGFYCQGIDKYECQGK